MNDARNNLESADDIRSLTKKYRVRSPNRNNIKNTDPSEAGVFLKLSSKYKDDYVALNLNRKFEQIGAAALIAPDLNFKIVEEKIYTAYQSLSPIVYDVIRNDSIFSESNSCSSLYSITREQCVIALKASKLVQEINGQLKKNDQNDLNFINSKINSFSDLNFIINVFTEKLLCKRTDENTKIYIERAVVKQLLKLHRLLHKALQELYKATNYNEEFLDEDMNLSKSKIPQINNSHSHYENKLNKLQNEYDGLDSTLSVLKGILRETSSSANDVRKLDRDQKCAKKSRSTNSANECRVIRKITDVAGARRSILDCLTELAEVRNYLQNNEIKEDLDMVDHIELSAHPNHKCNRNDVPHLHAKLNGIPIVLKLSQEAITSLLSINNCNSKSDKKAQSSLRKEKVKHRNDDDSSLTLLAAECFGLNMNENEDLMYNRDTKIKENYPTKQSSEESVLENVKSLEYLKKKLRNLDKNRLPLNYNQDSKETCTLPDNLIAENSVNSDSTENTALSNSIQFISDSTISSLSFTEDKGSTSESNSVKIKENKYKNRKNKVFTLKFSYHSLSSTSGYCTNEDDKNQKIKPNRSKKNFSLIINNQTKSNYKDKAKYRSLTRKIISKKPFERLIYCLPCITEINESEHVEVDKEQPEPLDSSVKRAINNFYSDRTNSTYLITENTSKLDTFKKPPSHIKFKQVFKDTANYDSVERSNLTEIKSSEDSVLMPVRAKSESSLTNESYPVELLFGQENICGNSSSSNNKTSTENGTKICRTSTSDTSIRKTEVKLSRSNSKLTAINSQYKSQEMYHYNNGIREQLEMLGVSNLSQICCPAKCCRKAKLSKRNKSALPYPVSLSSLPLDESDIEFIKNRIATEINEKAKSNSNYRRPNLDYYIDLGNNLNGNGDGYDVRYFEVNKHVPLESEREMLTNDKKNIKTTGVEDMGHSKSELPCLNETKATNKKQPSKIAERLVPWGPKTFEVRVFERVNGDSPGGIQQNAASKATNTTKKRPHYREEESAFQLNALFEQPRVTELPRGHESHLQAWTSSVTSSIPLPRTGNITRSISDTMIFEKRSLDSSCGSSTGNSSTLTSLRMPNKRDGLGTILISTVQPNEHDRMSSNFTVRNVNNCQKVDVGLDSIESLRIKPLSAREKHRHEQFLSPSTAPIQYSAYSNTNDAGDVFPQKGPRMQVNISLDHYHKANIPPVSMDYNVDFMKWKDDFVWQRRRSRNISRQVNSFDEHHKSCFDNNQPCHCGRRKRFFNSNECDYSGDAYERGCTPPLTAAKSYLISPKCYYCQVCHSDRKTPTSPSEVNGEGNKGAIAKKCVSRNTGIHKRYYFVNNSLSGNRNQNRAPVSSEYQYAVHKYVQVNNDIRKSSRHKNTIKTNRWKTEKQTNSAITRCDTKDKSKMQNGEIRSFVFQSNIKAQSLFHTYPHSRQKHETITYKNEKLCKYHENRFRHRSTENLNKEYARDKKRDDIMGYPNHRKKWCNDIEGNVIQMYKHNSKHSNDLHDRPNKSFLMPFNDVLKHHTNTHRQSTYSDVFQHVFKLIKSEKQMNDAQFDLRISCIKNVATSTSNNVHYKKEHIDGVRNNGNKVNDERYRLEKSTQTPPVTYRNATFFSSKLIKGKIATNIVTNQSAHLSTRRNPKNIQELRPKEHSKQSKTFNEQCARTENKYAAQICIHKQQIQNNETAHFIKPLKGISNFQKCSSNQKNSHSHSNNTHLTKSNNLKLRKSVVLLNKKVITQHIDCIIDDATKIALKPLSEERIELKSYKGKPFKQVNYNNNGNVDRRIFKSRLLACRSSLAVHDQSKHDVSSDSFWTPPDYGEEDFDLKPKFDENVNMEEPSKFDEKELQFVYKAQAKKSRSHLQGRKDTLELPLSTKSSFAKPSKSEISNYYQASSSDHKQTISRKDKSINMKDNSDSYGHSTNENPHINVLNRSNIDTSQSSEDVAQCKLKPLASVRNKSEHSKVCWALTKVKINDDGSQDFEIIESSPIPPGRFLVPSANSVVIMGNQPYICEGDK